ncbi:unnamed protein product [Cuscuta epithymum]|uniref:DUF1985 domain-containing protein n=1 Tax=Cuscuta epithymum TaxID=186058 RepID=A0AAV0DYR2_9ASTE|nr:unnamed protein product [Cuscuta epithymum]
MLLLRLVHQQFTDELWFCVRGKLLKFTFNDFVCITGQLSTGERPELSTDQKDCIAKKFFHGRTNITFQQLKNRMEDYKAPRRGDPLQGVKLASLYYTLCVLLSRDKRTKINPDFVKWVDDFQSFKKYPWAMESYNLTVTHMKSLMVGQPKCFNENKAGDPLYEKVKYTMFGHTRVYRTLQN